MNKFSVTHFLISLLLVAALSKIAEVNATLIPCSNTLDLPNCSAENCGSTCVRKYGSNSNGGQCTANNKCLCAYQFECNNNCVCPTH